MLLKTGIIRLIILRLIIYMLKEILFCPDLVFKSNLIFSNTNMTGIRIKIPKRVNNTELIKGIFLAVELPLHAIS